MRIFNFKIWFSVIGRKHKSISITNSHHEWIIKFGPGIYIHKYSKEK